MSKIEIAITPNVFGEGYHFTVDGKNIPDKEARIDTPAYPLILSPKGTSDFFIDDSYTLFNPKIDNLDERMGWEDFYPVLETICKSAKKIGLPSISVRKKVFKNRDYVKRGETLKLDLEKSEIAVSFPHKKAFHRDENDDITSISIIFDSEKARDVYLKLADKLSQKIKKVVEE